jgi:hypothetical protein
MSAPQTQPGGGRKIIGPAIAIAAFVVLAVAYVSVLRGYSHEGESRSFKVEDTQNADEDYIDVTVKIIAVDPVKGDMTARIAFDPQGALAKDEVSLAEDVTLLINSATGKQEHKFEKGKRMNPIDATVALDGQSSDYPFDSHAAELWLLMTTPVKVKPAESHAPADEEEAAAPRPKAPASVLDTNDPVPMAVVFEGSIPGLKLAAEKDKENDVGFTRVEMKVTRSSTVIFFSVFVMILMLALASAVVFMMLRFWLAKRKIEVSAMSVYGAMLFAFPALRNSQPAVPPLGTYSDYVSFFWAEMLVAISLVTIIWLWVLRRPS